MKSGQKQSRDSSKSNAAVLFNRYVWLVDTIYRAGHISFEEINDRWKHSSLNDTSEELPLKTFHNHKNALFYKFREFLFYLFAKLVCQRFAGRFVNVEFETVISL